MLLTIIPLIYCLVRDTLCCPLWYIHQQVDGHYLHQNVKYSISCVDNAVVMIVSDEVEMVASAKLRQVLEFFFLELARRRMAMKLQEECEGCKEDYPSQWDHACCMTSDHELWAFHFDDVRNSIDLTLVPDVCEQLVKLMNMPMTDDWTAFVFNLLSMDFCVAEMIAGDISYGNEHAIVDFVNNMCDIKENGQELSSEIFNEFVNIY